MSQQANAHHRDVQLEVGSLVLVRLLPYRQTTLTTRLSHKLAKRYYGPFKVLERVRTVAYRLDLPLGCKINPVFHISNLKPYQRPIPKGIHPLPPQSVDNWPLLIPAVVCASRTILRLN